MLESRANPLEQAPAEPLEAPAGLRILVVSSDTYPPSRVDVSILFGKELAGRGHRIDWILQSEQACASAYAILWGGSTVWVGATDLGSSLLHRIRKHARGILHDLKLFSLMSSQRYDIIEVKDKFISGVFALIAARRARKRFVFWLSYPFAEEYILKSRDGTARYPFLYLVRGLAHKFLLYRILLPAADHVFVQSEQMRRDVAAEGIALDKMTAVPMGINAEMYAGVGERVERQRIARGERCFLYLGILGKVRRLDFLLRVLVLVRREIPGVKLYFVGGSENPSDVEFLRQEAQRLGIADAAIFVGQLPQAEALRYVQDADVCVSPFYPTPILNSTSPTKLVEYLAMGKAVVANDHPEQRLVIEQSGGGYCVPYEETAFADAIVKLLKAPDEAAAMGARGRRYALAHRSYARIAESVDAAFRRLAVPARG